MRRSKTGQGGSPVPAEPAATRAPEKGVGDEGLSGALDDGDEVSWTAGKETFCPVKFHGFEVGPVTVTTRVRPRETAADAIARAKAVATAAWEAEFEEKLKLHLERVREAAGTARGARS